MDTLVKLTAIEKRYGRTVALDLNQMTIRAGRLYLLTGPNGSGKSTLLNILALLTRPDEGEMHFAGEKVTWNGAALTRLRRNITLLHQAPYLFRGTVADNVAFGLSVRGIRGADARRLVGEALATVGLAGFEDRKTGQLSGGEAQRVAMARALAIRPDLLLLDEPLANVDKQSAQVLEEVISALPGGGTTVVMSSHDPYHEERLPCEVISLLGGRIEQSALIGRHLERPWKEVPLCPALKMHGA